MTWKKKGLIFCVDKNHGWMQTHASVATVDKIGGNRLRVYIGTRNEKNLSFITFIELDADDPAKVLYVHDKPVLTPGETGTFDDCGAMPSWIVNQGHKKYLYYLGWNVRNTIPYHNSIGLAVSKDGGVTFERYSKGPLIDRNHIEPHFSALPCVMVEGKKWRMWYLSCVKWAVFGNKQEPYYHIKYAESKDGINWIRQGQVCIDFKNNHECGLARACVVKDAKLYKMWYSYRNLENYRTDRNNSYRIGYAESKDGIKWIRKDAQAGIDVSDSGWDSQMIEYPYVYDHKGTRYMFYNGNGFGRSGLGYAVTGQENAKG